jgi:hypothetical protein
MSDKRRDSARPTLSRRTLLSGCVAGVASLAGCGGIETVGDTGSAGRGGGAGNTETPTYDTGRLRTLGYANGPTAPPAFPAEIEPAVVERHYERARALLDDVPEEPSVPNEAVTEELRQQADRVADLVNSGADETDAEAGGETSGETGGETSGETGGETSGETGGETTVTLAELERARRVRREVAELWGAYRAATGNTSREAFRTRRREVRADRRAFAAEWTYRGGTAADALAVHAELESLLAESRRGTEAWPPFPDDPETAPLTAGELVRSVEGARAALSDAETLREAALDATATVDSHYDAISRASGRLQHVVAMERRRIDDFADATVSRLPYDRPIEGTPAAEVFREAQLRLRRVAEGDRLAREQGRLATATVRAGHHLAATRAFARVVDGIDGGKYGAVGSAARVETARRKAVEALQTEWNSEPNALSVAVATPAVSAVRDGDFTLRRLSGNVEGVAEAFGLYVFGRYLAEAVSGVVAEIEVGLDGDSA